MKCVSMSTIFWEFNGDSKSIDARTYDLAEVSWNRARDIYFHLILNRAREYPVPLHVDISEPKDGHIRTIIRFRGQDALVADFVQKDIFESEEKNVRRILNHVPTNLDIPHYAIEMGYWILNIQLGDYTEVNYYEYLEKWLLGEMK